MMMLPSKEILELYDKIAKSTDKEEIKKIKEEIRLLSKNEKEQPIEKLC